MQVFYLYIGFVATNHNRILHAFNFCNEWDDPRDEIKAVRNNDG